MGVVKFSVIYCDTSYACDSCYSNEAEGNTLVAIYIRNLSKVTTKESEKDCEAIDMGVLLSVNKPQ